MEQTIKEYNVHIWYGIRPLNWIRKQFLSEISSSKLNQEKLCKLRKLQTNQMFRFRFTQLRCHWSFLENDNLDITLPRS